MGDIVNFPQQKTEGKWRGTIICMVDGCKRNDGEGRCISIDSDFEIQILMGLHGFPECADYEPKEGWPQEKKKG